MDDLLGDLTLAAAIYIAAGTIIAVFYRLLWRGPFRFRHIVAWPVIHGCLLWAFAPPTWLAPAPRHVAADKRRAEALRSIRAGGG